MAFRYSGTGWQVAEPIRTFGDQIMDARGHTNSYPVDGTLGDTAHSNRVSDHNPDENGVVRALDFYEWTPGIVDSIGEALRLSKDPRIKYFIHDNRMFASYNAAGGPAWEWRPYTGPNGHETHGHLSTLPSGDNNTNPFQIAQEVDLMTVSSWAQASWDEAKKLGIITDDSVPKATVTVEQLMVFLNRAGAFDQAGNVPTVDQVARDAAAKANQTLSKIKAVI